jgi:hypothetical protein
MGCHENMKKGLKRERCQNEACNKLFCAKCYSPDLPFCKECTAKGVADGVVVNPADDSAGGEAKTADEPGAVDVAAAEGSVAGGDSAAADDAAVDVAAAEGSVAGGVSAAADDAAVDGGAGEEEPAAAADVDGAVVDEIGVVDGAAADGSVAGGDSAAADDAAVDGAVVEAEAVDEAAVDGAAADEAEAADGAVVGAEAADEGIEEADDSCAADDPDGDGSDVELSAVDAAMVANLRAQAVFVANPRNAFELRIRGELFTLTNSRNCLFTLATYPPEVPSSLAILPYECTEYIQQILPNWMERHVAHPTNESRKNVMKFMYELVAWLYSAWMNFGEDRAGDVCHEEQTPPEREREYLVLFHFWVTQLMKMVLGSKIPVRPDPDRSKYLRPVIRMVHVLAQVIVRLVSCFLFLSSHTVFVCFVGHRRSGYGREHVFVVQAPETWECFQ